MKNKLTGLVEELFQTAPENDRCPYIRKDEISPYCSKDLLENQEISEERRMVCDHFSLQLWCLYQSHSECIFYRGKSI